MRVVGLILLLLLLSSFVKALEDETSHDSLNFNESQMEPVNPNKKFGGEKLNPIVVCGIAIVLLVGGYFGYKYLKHR